MTGWFSDPEWLRIQENLPIFCVDLVAVRESRTGRHPVEVGLILRETPHQGKRWCLIGGRLRHGETVESGLRREWESALEPTLPWGRLLLPHPLLVEYAQDARPGRPHDPRRQAVCATQAVLTDGVAAARGDEALDFRWFAPADLDDQVVGFGQEFVVAGLLERIDTAQG